MNYNKDCCLQTNLMIIKQDLHYSGVQYFVIQDYTCTKNLYQQRDAKKKVMKKYLGNKSTKYSIKSISEYKK